ncbi:hypothetical protein JHD46_08555 [Sulfurimonas sp. SAG-AH-194-C20]|nr:hypothetical protein [Sulfurimonas sp. SAG-AH-194-C20]MDF1879686.1 hypothetical protein [Sulfurimonas sp. SAG-AH-194-C20]
MIRLGTEDEDELLLVGAAINFTNVLNKLILDKKLSHANYELVLNVISYCENILDWEEYEIEDYADRYFKILFNTQNKDFTKVEVPSAFNGEYNLGVKISAREKSIVVERTFTTMYGEASKQTKVFDLQEKNTE